MTIAKENKLPTMPAWVFLDSELNPSEDKNLATVPDDRLREACGIIPDFFLIAVLEGMETASGPSLENVSEGMDTAYRFGGFSYPFEGAVSPEGIYHSPFDDDDPMPPLVRFTHGALELFIYQYAITALRDRASGAFKVGRFD